MSEFVAELLTPEKFSLYWPNIRARLKQVEHTWDKWWTLDYFFNASMERRIQVWTVGPPDKVRLVVFTQILYYPANVVLQAFLAFGGDMEEALPPLGAALEKFSAQNGCTMAHIVGRRGWTKFLEPFGFEEQSVNLFRAVETMRIQ